MAKRTQVLLLCAAMAAVLALSLVLATNVHTEITDHMAGYEDSLPVVSMPWGSMHAALAVWCAALGWSVIGLVWCFTRKKVQLPAATFLLLVLGGVMAVAVQWPHMNKGWDSMVHADWVRMFSGADGLSLSGYIGSFNTWFFGYLPYTAGMTIANLFGMPYTVYGTFTLMVGMLTYAAMCSSAVAAAPKYKLAFMAAALIPTAVFQSVNISYDAPIAASLLLGTALVMRELCTPDERLKGKNAVAMAMLFSLGTIAKPAYSMSLMLMWLMPKGKFAGKRQRIVFCVFVLVLLAACLGSMALGMYGDQLNGDDRMEGSDPAGQIASFMSNPHKTLSVLGRYLTQEVPVLFKLGCSTWAYCGANGGISLAALVTLLFAAFIALDEKHGPVLTWRRRVMIALTGFLPLLGLILAQWLVSTPVDSATVVGMQPRYVVPVLVYSALTLALPDKWRAAGGKFGRAAAFAVAAVMLALVYMSGWEYGLVNVQGIVFL